MKGSKTKANKIARSGSYAGMETKANCGKSTKSPASGQAKIGNTWSKSCSSDANLKGGTGASAAS